MLSNCCFVYIENTGLCSRCKEHCEAVSEIENKNDKERK